VSSTAMYSFLLKRCAVPGVFVLSKFRMLDGSHMDAHKIYDLIGPALLICYRARVTWIRH